MKEGWFPRLNVLALAFHVSGTVFNHVTVVCVWGGGAAKHFLLQPREHVQPPEQSLAFENYLM